MSAPGEITRLLDDWRSGDRTAFDRLLPLVYDELRQVASSRMRRERPDHVLQTTALVHEAYLRLVDQKRVHLETRAHFFSVAARVMRHILVDYARGRRRAKRGGGHTDIPLHDVAALSDAYAEELMAVHVALENLTTFDPRKSKVFELRYFGGLSVDEVAVALDVSPATVARDWRMAKAWLRREIGDGSVDGT